MAIGIRIVVAASLFTTSYAMSNRTCHAVAGAGATDRWCMSNCNYNPPNCPSSMCVCDDSPTPPPPGPPAPPTPPTPPTPPAPAPPIPTEVIGYYSWNWGKGSSGPPGANAGCAFTGQTDVSKAISGYTPGAAWCCPELKGTKYITLGGGNSAGVFNVASLKSIATTASLDAIKKANYSGIMFDVEEVDGPSSETIPAFAAAFAAAKSAGFVVALTTSHSAPYQCDSPADAVALVKAWVKDSNLDIISPQLYSSGQEAKPEFAETSSCKDAGCSWSLYVGGKPIFAPSIVGAEQYDAVKTWATTENLSPRGYFEWKQR